jgi:tetratricopeptide (TPR) repeat protein
VSRHKLGAVLIAIVFSMCLPGQILDNLMAHPFEIGADIPSVQGEIRNLHGNVMELGVALYDVSGGRKVEQTDITPDGTFRLANVRPGTYLLKVVDSSHESILEEVVHIGAAGEPLTLRLPESSSKPSVTATVSSDQLQHPLSAKGAKMIRKAQSLAAAADHLKAIEELKQARKEPSAVPYAHALLGQEYLKTGQAAPAAEELEQASVMLPHDAIVHSNFGYALFLMGDAARGEREVRRALELDRSNSPAQRLLGYIQKARQSNAPASSFR